MQKVVYAKLKNSLISARKVRLVADLVRGKTPKQAEGILQFTDKTAAKDVLKNLKSAVANAVNNEGWNANDLLIKEIFVDDAQIYKRGRPAARGRYRAIMKRNCHITIGLVNIKEIVNVAKEKSTEKSVKVEKVEKAEKEVEKESVSTKKEVKPKLSKIKKESK